MAKLAVVTGASTGIGLATARALRAAGWDVVAVARRAERLNALAEEIGVHAVPTDLTSDAAVAELVRVLEQLGGVDALVNIAGGARGSESVEGGSIADWAWMFEANVLATKRLTSAVLPLLRDAARDRGVASIVTLTSTAGMVAYPGGGGYNAAKFAEHALVGALRLELAGEPIRVIEVAPGLVKTDEFALNRLGGDKAAAEAIYAGVDEPLTAEDVADTIVYSLQAPSHVNLDLVVLRPVAQAAQHLLIREPLTVKSTP